MAFEVRNGGLTTKNRKTNMSPIADALALPRECIVDTLRDREKLILAASGHQHYVEGSYRVRRDEDKVVDAGLHGDRLINGLATLFLYLTPDPQPLQTCLLLFVEFLMWQRTKHQ